MIVTFYSHNLFFFLGLLISSHAFCFCSPGNSCLSKDFGKGVVLTQCYHAEIFGHAFHPLPVHCLHVPLTCAGAAGPTMGQEPRSSSAIGLIHRDPACRSAATAPGTSVPATSLASSCCLCCQKHLSSATTSSQGSLCCTSLELLPCPSFSGLWFGVSFSPAWLSPIHASSRYS